MANKLEEFLVISEGVFGCVGVSKEIEALFALKKSTIVFSGGCTGFWYLGKQEAGAGEDKVFHRWYRCLFWPFANLWRDMGLFLAETEVNTII